MNVGSDVSFRDPLVVGCDEDPRLVVLALHHAGGDLPQASMSRPGVGLVETATPGRSRHLPGPRTACARAENPWLT